MDARWYQAEAVTKTFKYMEDVPEGHPLIVCPTGSGKSFILSMIASVLVDASYRVLVVSHVEEIISQDAEALEDMLSKELVGVYAASMKRRERRRVTVASIHSIYKKASLFSSYEYIIIDEAHTIPHKGQGMYRTLINGLQNVTVIGLTATPFRLGTGYLTDGDGALFTDVVFDVPVEQLIQDGFLSPLRTNGTSNSMDTDKLAVVNGDYSTSGMEERFNQLEMTDRITKELVKYKERYKSWLLFAINIKHAESITAMLNTAGVVTECIHSKQPYKTRKQNIATFKQGAIQALVSVATLTTGFNHPAVDLIGLIRPTQSPVLHIQMIGRGLRKAKGKAYCMVLDFAGNIMRLGPINDVRLKTSKSTGQGEPPVKLCAQCNTHVHASAKVCYVCGYVFPESATKLVQQASSLAVVLEGGKNKDLSGWYPVSSIQYVRYNSRNNIVSMKVSYTLGNNKVIHEYVNPLGSTKSNFNWQYWWKYRTDEPVPKTITNMVKLSTSLKKPKMVNVDYSGKYPKIKESTF